MGSIAHKHGRATAVVATTGSVCGIGVDLEFDEGLHDADLTSEIVTDKEATQLLLLRAAHPTLVSGATLVLAAKEALFKAVFPIERTEFGFADVQLAFDAATRSFRGVVFPGQATLAVRGAYEVDARWVVAAAVSTR